MRFARDIERLSHQSGVRLDFIKNVLSHLERGQRLLAGDPWDAPGNHAVRRSFRAPAAAVRPWSTGKRRVADGKGRFHREPDGVLAGVIERNIFVRLEQAELADTFGRNAAGRQVGHAAAGKLHAHIGDVHLLRKNVNARRADLLGRLLA